MVKRIKRSQFDFTNVFRFIIIVVVGKIYDEKGGGNLAKEAIQEILAVEQEAQAILQRAKDEAKQLQVETEETIIQQKRRILSEANQKAEKIKQGFEEEATRMSQSIRDNAQERINRLKMVDDAALRPAVSKIIEEVKAYGNR